MAYVITEKCLGERYATCVDVCPVDCIHPGDYEGEEFMVIDPDACIDCSLCKPECPIDAIVETEDDDPEWAEINRRLALDEGWTDHDPVEPRPRDDPPRKPGNEIVNP
jgi:ferredoxin